jgi:hypothetical protein
MAQSTGVMVNVCGPAVAVNVNLAACAMAPEKMCRSIMGMITAAYEHPCAPPLPLPSAGAAVSGPSPERHGHRPRR